MEGISDHFVRSYPPPLPSRLVRSASFLYSSEILDGAAAQLQYEV